MVGIIFGTPSVKLPSVSGAESGADGPSMKADVERTLPLGLSLGDIEALVPPAAVFTPVPIVGDEGLLRLRDRLSGDVRGRGRIWVGECGSIMTPAMSMSFSLLGSVKSTRGGAFQHQKTEVCGLLVVRNNSYRWLRYRFLLMKRMAAFDTPSAFRTVSKVVLYHDPGRTAPCVEA